MGVGSRAQTQIDSACIRTIKKSLNNGLLQIVYSVYSMSYKAELIIGSDKQSRVTFIFQLIVVPRQNLADFCDAFAFTLTGRTNESGQTHSWKCISTMLDFCIA
jgi:hypothetical protein